MAQSKGGQYSCYVASWSFNVRSYYLLGWGQGGTGVHVGEVQKQTCQVLKMDLSESSLWHAKRSTITGLPAGRGWAILSTESPKIGTKVGFISMGVLPQKFFIFYLQIMDDLGKTLLQVLASISLNNSVILKIKKIWIDVSQMGHKRECIHANQCWHVWKKDKDTMQILTHRLEKGRWKCLDNIWCYTSLNQIDCIMTCHQM